ncbi:MAG TPA: ATPase, partial [Gammaproteobacteria bacterium]|nr:ATPase [Gammaproteobacteria bacterium]
MSEGTITWVHGPVLHARSEETFQVHEAVAVGSKGLLGEVIHLDGRKLVIQVYEDTTGLRPGGPVRGHGQP